MRKFALLICLLLFASFVFNGRGDAQDNHPKSSRARRVKPAPTPKPDDNVLDLLPDETPTPLSDPTNEYIPGQIPRGTPSSTATTPSAIPKWQYLFSDHDVAYAYNAYRVTHPAPNIVRLWVKRLRYGKAYEEYVEQMGRLSYNYSDYEDSVSLDEYDCGKLRYRILRTIDYRRGGDVIFSANYEENGTTRWKDILPDSVGERFVKIICGLAAKQ